MRTALYNTKYLQRWITKSITYSNRLEYSQDSMRKILGREGLWEEYMETKNTLRMARTSFAAGFPQKVL